MAFIQNILAELSAAALFLIPGLLLLKGRGKLTAKYIPGYLLFTLYLCAVMILVGLPNITYIRFDPSGNLIPFRDMISDLRSTALNVLLFVPLGFFLRLLWRRYRRLGRALRFGFLLSLAVELLQVFTYRATDVNDLLTNTLGTALGYLLAGCFPKGLDCPLRELRLLLLTAALVMLLGQPLILTLFWSII